MVKRHEINFTQGALLKKMIIYALPIVGVNVLQLLFTMADLSVIGIFTGNDTAIAAVGACTPIINLLIGFFTGLSVGANVLIARCVGASNKEKARKLVGTSVFVSVVFGIFLMIVGVVLAEQILIWTDCSKSVLPYATTYLRIYCLGMPIIMLYNFSAAILRAVGDTLRPFIFLLIGGILNVCLNIFFIAVVGWDVQGVAIATVASNAVSGISALVLMYKNDGYAKIDRAHFKIFKQEFSEIFTIGLPMAISKCLFSFANVIVQAQLNALGETAMAAQSITKEIDGFVLEAVHGISVATLAVISQNFGAKKLGRIKKVIFLSILMELVVCLSLGAILLFAGRLFCGVMTSTEEVLDLCMVRITTVSIFYIFLGLLNIVQESIRGIGYSFTSLMMNVFANIVLRLIYIYFVYPLICIFPFKDNVSAIAHNLRMLYVLYPASWAISTIIAGVALVILFRKVKKNLQTQQNEEEQTSDSEKEAC